MTGLPASIEDLRGRFLWTADGMDSWRVLRASRGARLLGDCDDFAVTALLIDCGGSFLRFWFALATFQAVFWLARAPSGNLHLMLWRRGKGWIDNLSPAWGPRAWARVAPLPLPFVAAKMLIGKVAR